MKKKLYKLLSLTLVLAFGVGFLSTVPVQAEDNEENSNGFGTSISLTPVSRVIEIASNSTYDDTIEVKNSGTKDLEFEIYAAPYAYSYSEEEDVYKLGFNTENQYTQMSRWITFKDQGGSWVKKATFTIAPGTAMNVAYRVTTPDNIPAGGQYSVIFAHSLSGETTTTGIKTEASPGMIFYARSIECEAIMSPQITSMTAGRKVNEQSNSENFYASAKVKNNGNIDFTAVGKLKVEPIIGSGSYETPSTGTNAMVSIIPETELGVSDEWADSPSFGIYKMTWTVTAGDKTETVEKIVFVNPVPFIIFSIILLTIIIVLVIIGVRKRKERRARLAV